MTSVYIFNSDLDRPNFFSLTYLRLLLYLEVFLQIPLFSQYTLNKHLPYANPSVENSESLGKIILPCAFFFFQDSIFLFISALYKR